MIPTLTREYSQPDDDVAIDEIWLRTIGFSEHHTPTKNEPADLIFKLPESPASPGYLEWLDGKLVLSDWLAAHRCSKERYNLPAKTRGELRLTLTVLGIKV